jgi:eukaryotic-like serine/threonine-protein kinase
VVPLEGDRKPRAFLSTNFTETGAHVSPDGRWVSYTSDESGRPEIYVRPFSEPGGQWQISTAGGINGRWRDDGKEFYYIAPDGQLMAVPISTRGSTLEPGAPVALFQSRSNLGGNLTRGQYRVAPDGRFLINVTTGDATSSPITLLLNWKPPAK